MSRYSRTRRLAKRLERSPNTTHKHGTLRERVVTTTKLTTSKSTRAPSFLSTALLAVRMGNYSLSSVSYLIIYRRKQQVEQRYSLSKGRPNLLSLRLERTRESSLSFFFLWEPHKIKNEDDDDDTWLTIKMRCITKLVENNKERERERGSSCVVLYVTKSRFHFINIEMEKIMMN